MTRHLPLLPCLLGLALCVWRPEWVSVAVLALCLCFALYLDHRERRGEGVEELIADITELRQLVQGEAAKRARERDAVNETLSGMVNAIEALQFDQKKLRGDMEALRVALGAKPGRPGL